MAVWKTVNLAVISQATRKVALYSNSKKRASRKSTKWQIQSVPTNQVVEDSSVVADKTLAISDLPRIQP